MALDKIEMKEFVGMSVIGDKDLMANRKEIMEAVEEIVSENEDLTDMRTLFEEETGEENNETDEKLATSDKDIDALKGALDKALENITDEKLVEKIKSLKDALDASKDTGTTDVETVKECVEILSF